MNPTPTMYELVAARKFAFLGTFFIIFTLSYGFLALIDFLPEKPEVVEETKVEEAQAEPAPLPKPVVVQETPEELLIPSLNRKVVVFNPATADIPTLDSALLKGLVRHPDSAKLGQEGNVLILGHSSYLPNVMNKSFQALNGIQNLKFGETIIVKSGTTEYTYRVDKVYESKASDYTVDTKVTGEKLTLVTCDSFGSKQDRFIVEATLQSKKAL